MEHYRVLTFTPVNHPNRQVRRVGFDLSDTYVEQCWSAVIGPSAVVLLRRMPELWRHEMRDGIYTFLFVPVGVPAATAVSMSLAFYFLRFSAGLLGGLMVAIRSIVQFVRAPQQT